MTVPTLGSGDVRSSKRIAVIRRASVIIDLASHPKRIPCLIVDSSAEGFRVRISSRLRRGQAVEVIPNDDPMHAVRCNVVWVGKPGSKQQGEAGLQTESVS
jgi:PilZ domain